MIKDKFFLVITTTIAVILISSFSFKKFDKQSFSISLVKDTVRVDTVAIDSLLVEGNFTYKLYKKKAHASYYAKKFHGRRTASGVRFDNNKLTAAHKKFPFGTRLRITNEHNGKHVIVTVTDRGPFVKGREIDLSRRAYMEMASNKNGGATLVTIEVMNKKRFSYQLPKGLLFK
ncbi:septal ring lytic transglycosylase RlpA family protein [Flavobacterium psychrophilum]|uniref:septal ring lytic transglycosylase RlpA family protein n=1 Tax=Flavobacterium psychrophilum TaxID=96345 RepID=UPI0004F68A0E|nr:septal ring lytic transglycosylase RlpA family protein [Flavobacterium psychrophilum]AIN73131.1 lipoprotein [Flavobacterium psychrophilum FPG3]EKT2070347.1 septal ring lytic transglycosylase RlpA family protein [Flavobacterium psychrophilum]EKT2072260.1 septal ring lytic transglycosylase RlpA family protein [Flavobacterium psychrophilum]EKT3965726.1 septal ring lytic transglycosylase RlpA family protein [Flavobacterium psychrophilum]EKT4491688.1 septal ring lytic transglycosylase RlpA famil